MQNAAALPRETVMPFSRADFFAVFVQYNTALWPAQVFAYAAVFLCLFLLLRRGRMSDPGILVVLAAMWAINGIGYHGLFFSAINPAAFLFAAFFVAEAVLFAVFAGRGTEVDFALRRDGRTAAGLLLIIFAILVYPLWGMAAGHRYPAMPMIGIAPCPTTIFTIGILLLGRWAVVRWLLVIPLAWSAIGGSAAIMLGVPQDFGLFAAGMIVGVFALGHRYDLPFARHGEETGA